MVGGEQELNLVKCAATKQSVMHPNQCNATKGLLLSTGPLQAHQAGAGLLQWECSVPVWEQEQSSCCHGALWTTASFRQFLLPPYVHVLYSFARESNISFGDKCTSLKSSVMPLRLLVSLWLSRSWDKSFIQSQAPNKSADLFM